MTPANATPSPPAPLPQGERGEYGAAPLPKGKSGALAITVRHYQALCGLALAAIFLVRIQQTSTAMPIALVTNLFIVLIGTLGILYRVRLSPIFVLIALAVPSLAEQHHSNENFGPDFRSLRFDVTDVLLSAAMLTYLIGQYRLHGLWFGVLPSDPRQTVEQQARREASLSAAELVGLIFPVLAFALLAEFVSRLLQQHWTFLDVQPRSQQLLAVAWAISLALFLGAHAFRYWRRQQMDHVSAQLLLQDALWNETRGEQRRVNRWLAWKKL